MYGKVFDCSYFGGCLNGGCYVMVMVVCNLVDYDGIIVGDLGFYLLKVVIGEMYGV